MIRFEGVVLDRGGTRVLDGVDLVVPTGGCTVLTGANGAGKSSLLWTVPGLLTPQQGRVSVAGVTAEEDRFAVRSTVGLLLQRPADLFVAETVGADVAFGPENLGLDRDAVTHRVDDALTRVGLPTAHDRPIRSLSGGEARWVALAGLLAMQPQVMLLDEPAAGLDADGRDRLLTIIEAARAAGQTLLVATHSPGQFAGCVTEQVALVDGTIDR
jgi:ABC-type cobalt transport system, ATPase component